jgi:hypothetical protein
MIDYFSDVDWKIKIVIEKLAGIKKKEKLYL